MKRPRTFLEALFIAALTILITMGVLILCAIGSIL